MRFGTKSVSNPQCDLTRGLPAIIDAAVDPFWFHLLRFEIERGRLGLCPDYPEEELLSQLMEITERLIASMDLSLYVDVGYEGDTPLFTLVVAE